MTETLGYSLKCYQQGVQAKAMTIARVLGYKQRLIHQSSATAESDPPASELVQPPPIQSLQEFCLDIDETSPQVDLQSPWLRLHHPSHSLGQQS